MTHKCEKCGSETTLIMKMGGLICVDCRVICFFPYGEDGVYEKEFKKMKKSYDEKSGEQDGDT